MAEAYFNIVVIGGPLTIVALAILASASYRGGDAELLDWRLARSPEREAELHRDEVEQMLEAQNRHRTRRGAPKRTLSQVIQHAHVSRLLADAPAG